MLETSARLLRLLSLLQTRRDWPGHTLAERLQVSPRTIRRDVDRLRELGYPVRATKGPEGGYRLDAGAELPPLLFDEEQAVAIAVALQTATTSVEGIAEPALRALATIRQVMPARLRHRVDALHVVNANRPGRSTVRAEDLLAVAETLRAREVLRFDYAGGSADGRPRRAEPHHLVMWRGRWYLVAWDLDRRDWRTFRVDRIRPRPPHGPRFTPRPLPSENVHAYISERFAPAPLPCRGTFLVRLPAEEVARWAGPDAVVEPVDANWCRVTASSWSWGALAAWVGLFDADVKVVGPDELVAATCEVAARYARAVP